MSQDIRRRVTLRVTVVLCQAQSLVKGHIVIYHPGENEVCRAVEDSGKFIYFVRGEALAYRADYRNTAAHARLKKKIDVVLCRIAEQFAPLFGDKLLV